MANVIGKREFLAAGVGLGVGMSASAAFAQTAKPAANGLVDDLGRSLARPSRKREIPHRMAKTTKLFLAPPSWPNAIATDPEGRGFWIAEQRHDGKQEAVWLVDFNGKVLHKVMTNCKDCGGIAYGNGCVWSGSNGASEKSHGSIPINGIFQTDMNSKQVSHRQIPFGSAADGGSCHGLTWQDDKLWIDANRLNNLMRIDPKTWEADFMFPIVRNERQHGIEYDNGFIWQVIGTQKPGSIDHAGYTPGLVKYDLSKMGQVVLTVDFVPGSCDMHDVAVHNGQLYGIDSGEHPGWPILPEYQRPGWPRVNSPTAGWVYQIDLI